MSDQDHERPRMPPRIKTPSWLGSTGSDPPPEIPSWAELPRLEVSDQVSGSMTFTFPKMPLLTPSESEASNVAELTPPPLGLPAAREEFPGLARLARSRQGGIKPPKAPVPISELARPIESLNGQGSSLGVPFRSSGGPVVYGMVLRNGTTEAVHEVRIEHELPIGPRYLTADPPPHQEGRRLIWDVGTLEPGDRRRFKITLQPNRPEDVPANAMALFRVYQCLHSRTRVRRPKITLNLQIPESVEAGATVPVAVEAINVGGGVADDVRVLVALPPGLSHSDWSALKFQRPTLGAGERCWFEGEAKIEQPGDYELQAYVVGNGRVLANVRAMLLVTGEAPRVADPVLPPEVGDSFLVFIVGNGLYALPVAGVAQVRRSSDGASGVIRTEGGSSPVIDLSAMLDQSDSTPSRIIVTRGGTALAVDRTVGIRHLPADIRRPGGKIPHATETTELDGQPVLILNPDALPRPPRA